MRIINFSVDGIRQAAEKGVYEWLAEQDADIICLQDIRVSDYDMDAYPLDGYFCYCFDSGIPNCNGVVIYSRHQPKALIYGFGFSSGVDMQGRYLQADFEQISIGSLMVPFITDAPESAEIRERFFYDLQNHLDKITHKRRDFIFCGNWDIPHQDIDIQNWHEDPLPKVSSSEQHWMEQVIGEIGYCDAFREYNYDEDEYSWWPSGTVGEGNGRRVDYQIISESLIDRVEYATFYKNKTFPSHLPLIVDYDLEV